MIIVYSIFVGPQQTLQKGCQFSKLHFEHIIGFGRSNSLGCVFDMVYSLKLKVGGLKGDWLNFSFLG